MRYFKFEDDETRKAIDDFFSRPYWHRVWIIQEISVASKVLVYCGADSTSLGNIEIVLARTKVGEKSLRSGDVPNFPSFRPAPVSEQTPSLVKLLISSRKSLATDKRDKVYALVGLASDGDRMVPVPNYEQPPEDVFEQMTRLLIKRCPNILLFRHPNRETHKCLPSWLPDWAELSGIYRPWHSSLAGPDHNSTSVPKILDNVQQAVATWSGKMVASIRPPLEFNGRLSLKMKGRIVDEVDDVLPLARDEKIDPKRTEEEYIRQQKTRTYEGKSQNLNNYNLTLAEIAKCISMERMVFSMDSDNLSRAVDHLSHLSS